MRVKQNDETLYSIYTWDKNAFTQINGEQLIEGKRHPSIFFENTDYQFWINFKRIDIEEPHKIELSFKEKLAMLKGESLRTMLMNLVRKD